jgi:hypothetical protein
MSKTITAIAAVFGFAGAVWALPPLLGNPGFEMEFGSREDMNVWGAFGESFGEAYQVYAGNGQTPAAAHEGKRVLQINVPHNSWNGIWQQTPWPENKPLEWHAWLMIRGGNLPENTTTFMKIEFYDALDHLLAEKTGERLSRDSNGQWREATLRMLSPPGTRSARLVLIAGSNSSGQALENRIFWDDVSLQTQD